MIKNRKAPSSAARQPLITAEGVHITEIPLRKPDYKTKPADGTRTLLDIIEERRLLSTGEGGSLSTGEGGSLHVAVQEEEVELFGLGMNAFFFAVPLTILLFWLDVLVHLQYRHETDYAEIVARCAKAFPGMCWGGWGKGGGKAGEGARRAGEWSCCVADGPASHLCDPLPLSSPKGPPRREAVFAGHERGRGLLHGQGRQPVRLLHGDEADAGAGHAVDLGRYRDGSAGRGAERRWRGCLHLVLWLWRSLRVQEGAGSLLFLFYRFCRVQLVLYPLHLCI